jgi:hypothetical protein
MQPPPSPSDELFTNAGIRHLRLEIPPEGIAELRAYRWRRARDAAERPKAQATVREGDAIYSDVAVHLKGAAGSFRPIDSKASFTLNFDKFNPGQRFHGLDKLSLNNSVQDPTFVCEKLCRELFLQAGVPVPRADYATVELNGRTLGLYVLTEGWDRRFLKRYFQDPGGNLYDPGMGRDINATLPVVCGDNPEDQAELKALAAAATEPDPARRLARLEEVLDLDRFITFAALEVLLWHWDGYTMNLNNYRVFHDRATGKVVFMPSGMDQMFRVPDGPIVVSGRGLVSRALLHIPAARQRYLERLAQLRATLFNPAALLARADELAARVQAALDTESLLVRARHEAAIQSLRERIVQRARSVDEQLTGIRHLVQLAPGQSIPLTNWVPRRASGQPAFHRSDASGTLQVRLADRGVGAWVCPLWLEEGCYRVEGRIKTRLVQADTTDPLEGAGLRVISPRKQTEGVEWDWFPLRRGRDPRRRVEVPALGFVPRRLAGTLDWTPSLYRVDLRQPVAELEVLCELRADAGEAWFELDSLRLIRER